MVQFANWKGGLTLAILLAGDILAAQSLMAQAQGANGPRWYLLYEVDIDAAVGARLQSTRDALRDTLRKNELGYTKLAVSDGAIVATLIDPAMRDEVQSLLAEVAPRMNSQIGETGAIRLEYSEQELSQLRSEVTQRSIEILRRRLDEAGVSELVVEQQGAAQIIIQVTGLQDPERLKRLIGSTAKLTFQFIDETVCVEQAQSDLLPPGSSLVPSQEGGHFVVEKRVILSGEDVADAAWNFDVTNSPVVTFTFDAPGARRFGIATRDNVGRRIAIMLDGKVLIAPVIREPILGGTGQILGSFTRESARDLAVLIRAGALPAPLILVEAHAE